MSVRPLLAPRYALPPHILEGMIRSGPPPQREGALNTLAMNGTFRARRRAVRAGHSLCTPAPGRRAVFSATIHSKLPGALQRSENMAPTGDLAVDEAYDALGSIHAFFSTTLDSPAPDSLPWSAAILVGHNYANACWNGAQIVCGDGCPFFNRFTCCLELLGHEAAHAFIQAKPGLLDCDEPGALAEHFADVFGILLKQHSLGQTAHQSDWLIGAGIFTERVNGVALRSMQAPGTAYHDILLGKDPQTSHVRHYLHTEKDNGGVHINSGILNRAFYLAATAIGGYAWERAGRLWRDTLCDPRLLPNTGFRRFAELLLDNAARLHTMQSSVYSAVRDALHEVGLFAPT